MQFGQTIPEAIVELPSAPTKFGISVKSISERNATHAVRLYFIKDLNFNVQSEKVGQNTRYNFTSQLNNGAGIKITVS